MADFSGVNGSIASVQVSGDGFSFTSGNFTFANATSGVLTLSGSSFSTNPVVGQIGAQLGQFTMTASSSEDIVLKHIEFNKQGNIGSPKMVIDSTTYTGTVVDSKLVFNTDIVIKKNTTKTAKIYADVS